MNKLCAAALLATLTGSTFAAEKKPISTELELGIISTTGNTKTQSFKSKIDVKQEFTHWRNHYLLEGLYKRDEIEVDDGSGTFIKEDRTTAEKYFGSAKGDYILNKEYAALFIYGEYDRNRFSGFDYQYTIALGFSNRLFTRDNSYLSYNIGPGMTSEKQEDTDADSNTYESDETFVIRVSAEYLYQLSENSKFTQTFSSNFATSNDKNTKTKSVTSITAQLIASLALRASYTIDYNSEVPVDRKHSDTETALTLVYSF